MGITSLTRAPAQAVFLYGTGAYALSAAVRYIRVRMAVGASGASTIVIDEFYA